MHYHTKKWGRIYFLPWLAVWGETVEKINLSPFLSVIVRGLTPPTSPRGNAVQRVWVRGR